MGRTRVYANSGLAHLSLACTFDSGALLASSVHLGDPYRDLTTTKQWRSMAASEYLLAFQSAIGKDEKISEQPIFGIQLLVAYEAGQSFLRLQPHAKESPVVAAGIAKLKKIPPSNAVTPLVLDLSDSKPLSLLLESSRE